MTETQYPVNAVSRVPLTEILRRVTRSIDFTKQRFEDPKNMYGYVTVDELWRKWLHAKSRDLSFWPLVDTIMAEGFDVPVMIVEEEDGWVMGNGHHRIVVALWACIDEIPVYFADSVNSWPSETDPRERRIDSYPSDLNELGRLADDRDAMHKLIWG